MDIKWIVYTLTHIKYVDGFVLILYRKCELDVWCDERICGFFLYLIKRFKTLGHLYRSQTQHDYDYFQ